MATVGQLTVRGSISGGQGPLEALGPNTQLFNAAIGVTQTVALVNGNVTVTVPAGTTLMYFAPPNATSPVPNPAYAGTITLKGVSGDTGIPLSNTYWTYIAFDTATAPSSLVFTATAAGTAYATFW